MMGAMLSITGIFGMASYSVSKRMRELGIRIALGAKRKEVLQAALGRPLKLLAYGSAAGLILGILASGCWHSSCIRRLLAIRWCLRVWSSPWHFSACWLLGFQRSARCRRTFDSAPRRVSHFFHEVRAYREYRQQHRAFHNESCRVAKQGGCGLQPTRRPQWPCRPSPWYGVAHAFLFAGGHRSAETDIEFCWQAPYHTASSFFSSR